MQDVAMSWTRTLHIPKKWQLVFVGCFCTLLLLKILRWHGNLLLESELLDRGAEHAETHHFPDEENHGINIKHDPKTVGLSAKGEKFSLDGKPITLISGAVHYFRFPRQYWRDRLMKMKACGLNAIETYVPWNKHEPKPGRFDFTGDLNITEFLLLAHEMGFLVLLRPGPYICSEWEFGGLPAWLLRDPTMKVRTLYPNFVDAVVKYFDKLLPMVRPLQYSNGGPIVAVQLDNEYGAYFHDEEYIPFLKRLMQRYNIVELLFVSDNIEGLQRQTIPDVLKTINFKYVKNHFDALKEMQPNSPLMVMEFWTGWFDWWGEQHHTLSVQEFGETLNEILSIGASVNFYMFYGGTNFGFMNGGYRDQQGHFQGDITSYDYDALISENGDLTPKYYKAKSIIAQYYPSYIPDQSLFKFSDKFPRKAYESIIVTEYISIWNTLSFVSKDKNEKTLSMEMLNINGGAGQAYGYTLYTSLLNTLGKEDVVITGFQNVCDRGILFIDFERKLVISETNKQTSVIITVMETSSDIRIDLLVENGGRINWLEFNNQRKGLLKPLIASNNRPIELWTMHAFEMEPLFIHQLLKSPDWKTVEYNETPNAPSFFKFILYIENETFDTYIDMSNWGKGVVFINGKNLGRYWSIGPQKSLYLPAPWLQTGENYIVVFEEKKPSKDIIFADKPSF